jgi:hypothetical protein
MSTASAAAARTSALTACGRRLNLRHLAVSRELDAIALPDLPDRRRTGLIAQLGQLAEEPFDARRRHHPGDLQEAGARVLQAVPDLLRRVDQRAGHDGHRPAVDDRAALPLVHEQHGVLGQQPVHEGGRAGRDGLRPDGDGGPAVLRVDLDDDVPGRGRPQLEALTLAGLQDVLECVGYFFVSPVPGLQQGHRMTNEISFTTPPMPIRP